MTEPPLQKICDWVIHVIRQPNYLQMVFYDNDKKSITNTIIMLSNEITKTEPDYSRELFDIKDSLFDGMLINPLTLGRLIEILHCLLEHRTNHENDLWNAIHPNIIETSKSLFLDGHFSNAVGNAYIKIIDRIKRIVSIVKPEMKNLDGDSLITNVFSANEPIIKFCDVSTRIEADYQRGIMELFRGANAAFRNTAAHTNKILLSKEEALRRLMFASLLMYKLDDAVAYSQINE